MEDAVLISERSAMRILGRVPKAMGRASMFRVFNRGEYRGWSIKVSGRVLNERCITLLNAA